MNTINSTSNSYNVYTQNNSQISNSQGQTKIHHHHHNKAETQDSPQFSKEGLKALDNSTKDACSTSPNSPLASLVANGTITQDQENSIKSAFQSARQANVTGTYGSNPTNPIDSLVNNGTLTQAQADAIKSSFQSLAQTKEGTDEVSDSQENTKIHHHRHHHMQHPQDVTPGGQTTSQDSQTSSQSPDILSTSSSSSS